MKRGKLDIDRIREAMKDRRIGRRVEYLQSVSSTNDVAWQMVGSQEDDGFAVFADQQTEGRGRRGRKWDSPRGAGVLCSVVLVDRSRELRSGEVSLAAAVAALDAIVRSTDIRPSIKWPNDLLISGKKVGGILVESRTADSSVSTFVIGIGINCLQQAGHFPPPLASSATSLDMETKYPVDRSALAIALLSELDRWFSEPGTWTDDILREEWRARSEMIGERVAVKQSGRVFQGSIIDVDPTAALVVQLDAGGIRAFNAGDTEMLHSSDSGDA